MPPPTQRIALLLAATLSCTMDSAALIIYGTGPNDVDNSLNVLAPNTLPPNGSPAVNVVKMGTAGSGIYLGNGYVLTANHVGLVDNGIVINGVSYDRDLTFDPLYINENVPTTAYEDFTDLKLIRILGMPPLPVVQKLPINHSSTADLASSSTLIAWGVGKGSIAALQGWDGGDSTTVALRWGTNSAPGSFTLEPFEGYLYRYDGLLLDFDRTLGPNTAQIAFLDSGSPLLQQIGGVWTVSGITTLAGPAYYDSDLAAPGDQPAACAFVRLQKYSHLLRAENWAKAKLGNAAASLTADTDFDGLPQLLEYAFKTDPNSAASAARPQVGMESGYLTLTYTQLLSATDLSYVVQESSDLTNPLNWAPATVVQEIVSNNGLTRIVKAKVAINSAPQKFLRLKVSTVVP